MLSDFVEVTVLEEAITTQVASFTTCGLLAQVTTGVQSARHVEYSSYNELVDAGMPTSVLDRARIFFSQDPNPGALTIGRQIPGTKQVSRVTITTADDGTWSFTVNGDSVSYLATLETEQEIAEGLFEAGTDIFRTHNLTASTPSGGIFDLTANVGGDSFTIGSLTVPGTGAGATSTPTANVAAEAVDTAMNAIRAAGNTTFVWTIESRAEANVDLMSSWAAAQATTESPALFVALMSDESIRDNDVGNPASDLALLGYDTTYLVWSKNPAEYRDMAELARQNAVDLDQFASTWALKGLIGITPDAGPGVVNPLTSAQIDNIRLHANTYTLEGGLGTTSFGKVVSGKFTDTVVSRFLTVARLKEGGFAVLRGSPTKIPMNATGAAMLEGAFRSVMTRLEAAGHFNPGWTVFVPDPATLTAAQRATRVLPGIQIRCQFTGAIHQTQITLFLSY